MRYQVPLATFAIATCGIQQSTLYKPAYLVAPVMYNMAWYHTVLSLLIKLSVLFVNINIKRDGTFQFGLGVDGLQVQPLWNNFSSNSPACFIDYTNNSGETGFLLQGSSNQACKVNITSAIGSHVNVELSNYVIHFSFTLSATGIGRNVLTNIS